MMHRADTIGVFQIESRAQMSMLPRLKPVNFYDIVIEVAIVRPGPIQGNMVHPYLRRKSKQEAVTYPSKALEAVLSKTLGVPLFQEQAMKVVMVAAGFSAGEADQLRRAMAAWRKNGAINKFYHKIINGMLANGYTLEFAEDTFKQIQGFGEYGFPESHSASFALLVYVSAWLKCHHPAVFCAALLNSQPMGFYAPAQIVRDAREHGVEVRPVDVNWSGWDCSLEVLPPLPLGEGRGEGTRTPSESPSSETPSDSAPLTLTLSRRERGPSASAPFAKNHPAVRLGFREIKGFSQAFARQIEIAQKDGDFVSIADFHQRTGLPKKAIEKLAEADAFGSLGLSRRQALWQVLELDDAQLPLFGERSQLSDFKSQIELPVMPLPQEVRIDYQTTSLSLKKHPVALIRDALTAQRIVTAKQANGSSPGRWVKVAGLVLIRQRPGTASGIVFITLEDETGVVNLIVRPNIWEKYRAAARHAGLLQCDGYVEKQDAVVHIMAKRLFDRSEMIAGYELASRDFH